VTSVAGDEDAWEARSNLIRRDVVEPVCDALADLINCKPRHASNVQRVRAQHALRDLDDLLLRVQTEGFAVVRVDLAEIDVEPHHVAALARDEQDIALIRRLDRGLEADIREVGDGEHIHDAPGVVGEVAVRLGADRIAHQTARTVAADNVLRADRLLGASFQIAYRGYNRTIAFRFDLQGDEILAIVRNQSRRRLLHVVQKILEQAGLIDDQVRKLREAVLGVLDAPGAHDRRAILRRRPPEDGFVHPVGLADEFLAQTESLERFDRAAGDAISLTHLERAAAALDKARADIGK